MTNKQESDEKADASGSDNEVDLADYGEVRKALRDGKLVPASATLPYK